MTDAADKRAYELLEQIASVWKRGESLHNHAPIIATELREAHKARDELAAEVIRLREIIKHYQNLYGSLRK